MAAKKKDEPVVIDDLDQVEVPDDKPSAVPGDADYDWSPHYPDKAKLFRYTLSNGQVVAIRKLKDIFSKQWMYQIRDIPDELGVQILAIDRAACPQAQALIAAVDAPIDGPDPLDDLWSAWTADRDSKEPVPAGE